jgi:hypothetical protein
MAPRECYSLSSQTKVELECNNLQSCLFDGTNGFDTDAGFVNVCPGFTSSLFIQWQCLSPPQTTITITSATNSPPLPPTCPTNYTLPSENQCSTTISSPYEPLFLTNSTLTYFGYPIFQQLVCQGSLLIILCPLDLLIHIYAAYFGIQSTTMSSTCSTSTMSSEYPAKCYIPNGLSSIVEQCEKKSSCQLRATANNLGGGDFCPQFQNKQLLVQYQCYSPVVYNMTVAKCGSSVLFSSSPPPPICNVTSTATNATIYSQTWCDGASASIVCPSGTSISILCAFYGIHPSLNACNIQSLVNMPVCYFASSMAILSSLCNGQTSCFIDTLAAQFVLDPCNGLDKALFAQWQCI